MIVQAGTLVNCISSEIWYQFLCIHATGWEGHAWWISRGRYVALCLTTRYRIVMASILGSMISDRYYIDSRISSYVIPKVRA